MALEAKQLLTILFVDQTDFCTLYHRQPWVEEEAVVIEVDQEILDHFQIGKVPQFRFYVRGSEVSHLVGTVPREDIVKLKKQVFGDLTYRNLNFRGQNGKSKKDDKDGGEGK